MFEFPLFPEQVLRTEAAAYACSMCPERCGWPIPPKWELPTTADFDGYGY